jgi:hypothetical protein
MFLDGTNTTLRSPKPFDVHTAVLINTSFSLTPKCRNQSLIFFKKEKLRRKCFPTQMHKRSELQNILMTLKNNVSMDEKKNTQRYCLS